MLQVMCRIFHSCETFHVCVHCHSTYTHQINLIFAQLYAQLFTKHCIEKASCYGSKLTICHNHSLINTLCRKKLGEAYSVEIFFKRST